jgi:hypothetical protein
VLDEARKALHNLELACDALQRRQNQEAARYLQDVELAVARIRHELSNAQKQVSPKPAKGAG